jgi:hypothetical protein
VDDLIIPAAAEEPADTEHDRKAQQSGS